MGIIETIPGQPTQNYAGVKIGNEWVGGMIANVGGRNEIMWQPTFDGTRGTLYGVGNILEYRGSGITEQVRAGNKGLYTIHRGTGNVRNVFEFTSIDPTRPNTPPTAGNFTDVFNGIVRSNVLNVVWDGRSMWMLGDRGMGWINLQTGVVTKTSGARGAASRFGLDSAWTTLGLSAIGSKLYGLAYFTDENVGLFEDNRYKVALFSVRPIGTLWTQGRTVVTDENWALIRGFFTYATSARADVDDGFYVVDGVGRDNAEGEREVYDQLIRFGVGSSDGPTNIGEHQSYGEDEFGDGMTLPAAENGLAWDGQKFWSTSSVRARNQGTVTHHLWNIDPVTGAHTRGPQLIGEAPGEIDCLFFVPD